MLSARIRRWLARVWAVRLASRALVLWRERNAASRRPFDAFRYLWRGREISNLTYALANRDAAVPFRAPARCGAGGRGALHARAR